MVVDAKMVIESLEKAKMVIERWVPMFEQYNAPCGIDCAINLMDELIKILALLALIWLTLLAMLIFKK